MRRATIEALRVFSCRVLWWFTGIVRGLGEEATDTGIVDVRYDLGGRVYSGTIQVIAVDGGFALEMQLLRSDGQSYYVYVESGPYRVTTRAGEGSEDRPGGLETINPVREARDEAEVEFD